MTSGITAGIAGGRRALFVAAIFAGSFLLFLVQPMAARMALPRLGGAPAVWNSAMLVYQTLLLAGYGWAHWLGRFPAAWQVRLHLSLLALAALWLPIGLFGWTPPADGSLALWVPALLFASLGPLFVAVAAQAPLLQRWFAEASGGADPYRLYAASNLGSFAGLLAYPLIVEPSLSTRGQSLTWSAAYLLLAGLVAVCGRGLSREAAPAALTAADAGEGGRPGGRALAWWLLLAFVPSGLMLATSTYVTTDIVAMPLLWVIPLGLYLLSFSIAFAARRWLADFLTQLAPVVLLLFGIVMIAGFTAAPYFNAALALVLMFVAATALHTALYRSRPSPAFLTTFYLAMAAGGAGGGLFAGLIAPIAFDWTWEYPILILAAAALVPRLYLTAGIKRMWTDRARAAIALALIATMVIALVLIRAQAPGGVFGDERRGLTFLVLAGAGVATLGTRLPYLLILTCGMALFGGVQALSLSLAGDARTRSYFGVYTISHQAGQRTLAHGTTVHGVQLTGSATRERTPTTYYSPGSGVGQAMRAAPSLYGAAARIGVVGLGTGTLACYAQPGQDWTFYEIDPAMVAIARDRGRFTFLSRCLPRARIVLGDARLRLQAEPPASLDLLALDAFSSDAVPMHLLTREAFAVYGRVLADDGLLLVHISNRFLDLAPVVAGAARAGGWHAIILDAEPSTLEAGATTSTWIAMSRKADPVRLLAALDPAWRPLTARAGETGWSDERASILPLLKGF